jgi:phage FluMu gp28-like protein
MNQVRRVKLKQGIASQPNDRLLNRFFDYQRRWLLDDRRFKIGLWARQTGKDYTCAAEAALDCCAHPGRHWLILACGERQALESLRKASEWAAIIGKEMNSTQGPPAPRAQESATEIHFENGSRITALPARPETVRGYSANIILTEFAFHDDADAIYQAIYPSLTNPLRGGVKKLRIISTPNGHGNLFHKLWLQSAETPNLFGRQEVTVHDAIRDGLPLDVAQLKAGLANPEAWSQEYECQFIDNSTVLLPYSLIEQCESAEATETAGDLSRGTGEIFVGIDFGRRNDLTACWVLERVGQELWTREVLTLDRMPTPAQFEQLVPRVQRARRVCIDYTGAGVGLGDLLAERFGAAESGSPYGKVELCHFTSGLKEELFPKLRAALERRKIWLPASSVIREDLHSIHKVVSQHGHIAYRASHTADGHSDRCTALALALRASESTPVLAAASTVGRKYAFVPRR